MNREVRGLGALRHYLVLVISDALASRSRDPLSDTRADLMKSVVLFVTLLARLIFAGALCMEKPSHRSSLLISYKRLGVVRKTSLKAVESGSL